jgi:hypothetical protein
MYQVSFSTTSKTIRKIKMVGYCKELEYPANTRDICMCTAGTALIHKSILF